MTTHARPTIAIDCDHIVADTNNAVRLFVNAVYGTSHTHEDYKVPGSYELYWERIWGTTEDEPDRLKHFINSGGLVTLEPLPGALEVLGRLKKRFRLVMVTARTASEVEFTHAWISAKALNLFDDVTFVHQWDDAGAQVSKGQICQEIGAQYLIDDSYDHCLTATEYGVWALLFGDYGWNRELKVKEPIVRAVDWPAVEEYFTHV